MSPLLLQDTSVLINLLATDRFSEVSTSTRWQFSICNAVQGETKSIWNVATQQREEITLDPFISAGSLLVLELDTDQERDFYVRICGLPGVGVGEAMCMALAQSRGIEFATDDRKATRVCLAAQPVIKTVSTPEILIDWQENTALPDAEMGKMICSIEHRAKFSLKANHPHFAWWQRQKEAAPL